MTAIRYRWLVTPSAYVAIAPICTHGCNVQNCHRSTHVLHNSIDHIWNWASFLPVSSLPRLSSHFARITVMFSGTNTSKHLKVKFGFRSTTFWVCLENRFTRIPKDINWVLTKACVWCFDQNPIFVLWNSYEPFSKHILNL